MTVTLMRLVDGDRETLLHRPSQPRMDLIVRNLDVASPAVRAVADGRPDASGTDDTTAHHGARAVSLDVRVFDTPAALVDELSRYLHPAARPYLYVRDDEWDVERRLRLRVNQFSAPMPAPYNVLRDVQLQWEAPDGVWEAAAVTEVTIAADTGQPAGRSHPAPHPRLYPATAPSGQIDLINPGSTWADQTVRLYGPAVGPRYTSDLTGETLEFTDALVIPDGEYIEVNTRERTANYLSDPDASRLDLLNFETSTWWQLAPGLNRVRYHPVSGVDIGAAALLAYRPAWL